MKVYTMAELFLLSLIIKNNRMSGYELEAYNKGDEESICTYRLYCNTDCKVISITHDKMWVNVVYETI